MRALEHLPVARDEHGGDLRARGSLARDGDARVGAALPDARLVPSRSGRRPRPDRRLRLERVRASGRSTRGTSQTGTRRQVTDHPVGLDRRVPTLDGEGVALVPGRERRRVRAAGSCSRSTAASTEPVPRRHPARLERGARAGARASSPRRSQRPRRLRRLRLARRRRRRTSVYRSTESVRLGSVDEGGFLRGALSADGSLLCLEHAEHGDLIHPALRVIDPRTGDTVGEQLDEGMSLIAQLLVAGPGRPAARVRARARRRRAARRSGISRPASGATSSSTSTGAVFVADWWPDALGAPAREPLRGPRPTVPLRARDRRARRRSPTEPGFVWKARVRPDGRVWLLHEQGHRQRLVLDDTGDGDPVARRRALRPARPYESWHFENPHGQRVHGFFVTPDDSGGPFPVLMFVHGGPTWLDLDRWQPEVQAYVDAGFAVGTGQLPRLDRLRPRVARHADREHRRAGARGRERGARATSSPAASPIPSARSSAATRGAATSRCSSSGKHPELWTCGIAGVPVGDYEDGIRGALAAPAGVRPRAARRARRRRTCRS